MSDNKKSGSGMFSDVFKAVATTAVGVASAVGSAIGAALPNGTSGRDPDLAGQWADVKEKENKRRSDSAFEKK